MLSLTWVTGGVNPQSRLPRETADNWAVSWTVSPKGAPASHPADLVTSRWRWHWHPQPAGARWRHCWVGPSCRRWVEAALWRCCPRTEVGQWPSRTGCNPRPCNGKENHFITWDKLSFSATNLFVRFFCKFCQISFYSTLYLILRVTKQEAEVRKQALPFVPARYIRTFDVISEVNYVLPRRR